MMLKKILIILWMFLFFFSSSFAEEEKVRLILFERDDCAHCADEKAFLEKLDIDEPWELVEYDIYSIEGNKYFLEITEKYGLSKVTPITLVGNSVIVGFDKPENSGLDLTEKIKAAGDAGLLGLSMDYYLGGGADVKDNGVACDSSDAEACTVSPADLGIVVEQKDSVGFLGKEIDLKNLSLFSISAILGFIDGFNPCAMWVLITFLIALSQLRDRKKMVYVVGIFIVAETIMYYLILNFWFATWNFVKLDNIVTPIIGTVAIFAGAYFIYKSWKSKGDLTCDVTSAEHQARTTRKIKNLATKEITIATTLAIFLLAFSVNIIEFACSIGIPQTFTKIIELNNLSMLAEQGYILLYTAMYMVDDLIVFGLALWGYKKFYQFGAKYSKLATWLSGFLMLGLGVVLVFFPSFLVF